MRTWVTNIMVLERICSNYFIRNDRLFQEDTVQTHTVNKRRTKKEIVGGVVGVLVLAVAPAEGRKERATVCS